MPGLGDGGDSDSSGDRDNGGRGDTGCDDRAWCVLRPPSWGLMLGVLLVFTLLTFSLSAGQILSAVLGRTGWRPTRH